MKFLRHLLLLVLCSMAAFSYSRQDQTKRFEGDKEIIVQMLNSGVNTDSVRRYIKERNIQDRLFLQVEELDEKLINDNARCTFYMALAYNLFDDANFNDTQTLLLRALKIAENIKNLRYQCAIYNLSANAFSESNMNDNALQNFRRAIKIAQQMPDEELLCTLYSNYASCFYRSWEMYETYLDSARKYNELAIDLAKKYNKKGELHLAYQCIGLIETDAGNYEKAESALRTALILNEELQDTEMEYYTRYQMGRMYTDQGNQGSMDSAFKYLNSAYKLAVENNDKIIIADIFYVFAKAYKNKGDYKTSADYALRFAEYNDSLIKYENSRVMAEMSEKYESAKNEAKINELNLIQKEKQDQINRQLYLIIGAVVVLVAVIIAAFSLYRSNLMRKKANRELSEKNHYIELQKGEVERQKEIVEAKNKEILDSIYYAKRIQQSLLPSNKYLERNLEQLKKEKKDKNK
jgi:tetratricopeptide (TPR) repeat protein